MFQQLIASNPSRASKKPLTLVCSAIIHGFLIVLLIAVPLIHPETLADLQKLAAPPPPLSSPQTTVVKLISNFRKPRQVACKLDPLFAPRFIPQEIDLSPLGTSGSIGEPGDIPQVGLPISASDGTGLFLGGFSHEAPRAILPPEPLSTAKAETHITRVRRGGEVQHANLVHQVKPSYPQLAKTARVQGSVVLDAIVDREGHVMNLKVLSGHPLLIPAAVEAVQQWRYRPTLLNGEPVEVLMQVTVNFSLGTP